MEKLKLPKSPHTGLKIYCHKCKRDNPTCNHYDIQRYKVRIHVPGTKNKKITKVLKSTIYNDAVVEAIIIEKELKTNNFQKVVVSEIGNDYSISDAVIRYNQYLSGNYEFSQFVKNISDDHRKECVKFCRYFCNTFKGKKDIQITRIVEVTKSDVARFYSWADAHYNSEKSFNKCLGALKAFFKFLIEIEDVQMKNPFASYEAKKAIKKNVETLTKDEFDSVISVIDTANPIIKLGGKGEKKNLYRFYLKDGFKLFLLTGGRREEVVELKWSDILTKIDGTKFFKIDNKKVNRQKDTDEYVKYLPINHDLFELLIKLGYNEKKTTNDFILYPDRKVKSITIMNDLSKAFTHYKKEAGITKTVSLKNLRKTYITWLRLVTGKDTGLLTSHGGEQVLIDHYIDSTILNAVEKAALNFKVYEV
ncbi:MAG: tyrosine-type recombinase/integrase [Bacteroidia bacterium]|nr:tyrosine-type recombinase/integrase [Bacteroidia bacterium]